MAIQTQMNIRTATRDDLQQLANLIHFEAYVHRHLDYRPALDWVGSHPFPVLEKRGEIYAALACPPDPPQIAWVRLFAANNRLAIERAWEYLWDTAKVQLYQEHKSIQAAALPMYSWFEKLLSHNGFQQTHQIVMLRCEIDRQTREKLASSTIIRPMTLDDLALVEDIDTRSFTLLWQNSKAYLEIAFRQAAVAAIAEYDGEPVGYQISTATPVGGHLARLAVYPKMQGKGIGRALLQDLLSQFARRGARALTVNTQKDNLASLKLYKAAGFQLTGEEYPVYEQPL
jgi:ribosomal-protein-alanine N-acetyltransferase